LKTIRQGSSGSAVTYAQERLAVHGLPVGVDGVFGGGTRRAVVTFQMQAGLGADGIVGPRTWDALLVEGRAVPPAAVVEEGRSQWMALVDDGLEHWAISHGVELPDCAAATAFAGLDDLGAREAGDSNLGPEIAHLVDGYRDYWQIGAGGGLPWCGMAASHWVRRGCGGHRVVDATDRGVWAATPLGVWLGGAKQAYEWALERGVFLSVDEVIATTDQVVPPGSLLIMRRGLSGSDDPGEVPAGHWAGHVAVTLYSAKPGKVSSVDANVSNMVAVRERDLTDILGFILWWDA